MLDSICAANAPTDVHMDSAKTRMRSRSTGNSGSGCFSWPIAEAACSVHQFWPDTISTDLHIFNLAAPVVDLPTTMSKFLHLGMRLEEVVCAATARPADAMGQPQLGRLRAGDPADVSILQLLEGEFTLTDSHGETRTAAHKLAPIGVFKNGVYQDSK